MPGGAGHLSRKHRVVINDDDAGVDVRVDAGSLKCCQLGTVRSASAVMHGDGAGAEPAACQRRRPWPRRIAGIGESPPLGRLHG